MQALIFDIDGTLLHSSAEDDRLYRLAVEQVLGHVRFRDSLHDYDHVSDTGILTQIFNDNDVPLDPSLVDAVKNAFFAGIEEYLDAHGPFPEIPGAADYLRRIAESSRHDFAIATGGWTADWQRTAGIVRRCGRTNRHHAACTKFARRRVFLDHLLRRWPLGSIREPGTRLEIHRRWPGNCGNRLISRRIAGVVWVFTWTRYFVRRSTGGSLFCCWLC